MNDTNAYRKAVGHGATDAVALARDLIRFESVNPPGAEAGCMEHLADLLSQAGLSVAVHEFAPGRPSLVARLEGTGKEAPLCFTGHLDVVPLGQEPWRSDPFAAEIVEGKLYGRGSSDMKSGVAAFVAAVLDRSQRAERPRRGLALVLTAGEETGCQGAFHLARIGVLGKASLLVVAEPSGNDVIVAHKGSMRIGVTVRGTTAHSSMPELGDNAVDRAAAMLVALGKKDFSAHRHDLLGLTTACVTTITGGMNINSVPDSARFTVDFRTVPGHAHDGLLDEMRALFGRSAEIELITDFPGFSTERENPAVAMVAEVVAELSGRRPELKGAPYFTDASALVPAFGGVPTVVLGPGEIDQCHRTDEYCFVDKINECKNIYYHLIESYCK